MNFENPIWIAGEILPGQFFINFTRRLSEIMQNTQQGEVITVFIDSRGGDTMTSFGIYDLLRSCPCQITGLVAGRAESAASLILQACDVRIMTEHSSLMLHKSTIDMKNISVADAQSTLGRFRELDERYYEIYCARSGRQFTELRHGEMRFTAAQAVEAELADQVLKNRPFK